MVGSLSFAQCFFVNGVYQNFDVFGTLHPTAQSTSCSFFNQILRAKILNKFASVIIHPFAYKTTKSVQN